MTTLNIIRGKQNAIKELVQQFGYSDMIKMYYAGEDVKIIQFVVYEKDKEAHSNDERRRTYLQVMLTNQLDCEVNVIVYETLYADRLDLDDINAQTAELSNEAGLKTLFKTDSLEKVTFNKPDESKKVFRESLLQKARKYLEDTGHTNQMPNKSNTLSLANHSSTLYSAPSGSKKRTSPKNSPNRKRTKFSESNVEINQTKRTITFAIPEDLPLSLLSDPDHIKKLAAEFINLLTNSVPKMQETSIENLETKKNTPTSSH